MTLPSRQRIRNSSPGGLRLSTLPLGHGGSPQYWLSHVDGEETFFVSFKPPEPGTEPRTLAWKAALLTTTLGPPPWFIDIDKTVVVDSNQIKKFGRRQFAAHLKMQIMLLNRMKNNLKNRQNKGWRTERKSIKTRIRRCKHRLLQNQSYSTSANWMKLGWKIPIDRMEYIVPSERKELSATL